MDRVRRARRVGKAPPQGRPRAGSARTYDDSASSPDQVVCRLCGRAFKAIRVLHLRAVHGYEGEHPVEDYKRQFGLRVAACEETCTALRDNRVERAIRDGQHWTAARIKAQLRARARVGQSLAQSQSPVRLQLAASRVFGSWDAALEAAGFDPREHRLAGRWNEVEVVRAIRERHAAGQSLVVSVIKKEQPDLYTAAWNHSGSWKNAMRTAGLDTRAHRMTRVWNLARATAWVQERLRDGRPITAAHIPKGLYGFAMRQGVGGWAGFVQSLGITYPGRLMRRDWSEATVLEEILLRQREGRALNVRSVRRDQGALAAQARKWFGSWDAALRAAGIDPMAVRLTRPRPQRSRSPADAPGQRPV